MGLYFGFRSCSSNPNEPLAVAPNPNPRNWELLQRFIGKNGYVLMVRYRGCTNFEGVKIMAYEGQYKLFAPGDPLDPHFQERGGPIARFRPDNAGWERACKLVESL